MGANLHQKVATYVLKVAIFISKNRWRLLRSPRPDIIRHVIKNVKNWLVPNIVNMDIKIHLFLSLTQPWYSFIQILKRETEWTRLNKAYVAMVSTFPKSVQTIPISNHSTINSIPTISWFKREYLQDVLFQIKRSMGNLRFYPWRVYLNYKETKGPFYPSIQFC